MKVYLDTHVLVWLYAGELSLLSKRARSLIESSNLLICPMNLLELEYLKEIEKISSNAKEILSMLQATIDLQVSDESFEQVIISSLKETWTRDPFDRIMVAQARIRNLALLTKDRSIHRHYAAATW